jgi:O-acetyl-ADP-ribose deacetylase (regulator of RNase III)
MPLIKTHGLEAATDGLAYFTPAKGADPLGAAIRKQGGARAEEELRLQRLRVGEAVVRRGYGTRSAYLVITAAPVFNLATGDGHDEFAVAVRACLDAAEKYSLASLAFGSWSLSSAGLPAIAAALAVYGVVDEWREAHPRRVLKRIVFALHDAAGYTAFKQVNDLSPKARQELAERVASEPPDAWQVD